MYISPDIKRRNKGEVLIVLFWVIIILGVIVFGLSYRAHQETTMVSNTLERSKAYSVTWAGVKSVMRTLNKDPNPNIDSWQDSWNTATLTGKTEDGKWKAVVLTDLERKVNINKVGKDVLKRIFYYVDPVLYCSLLDWLDSEEPPLRTRDPNTGKVLGAEDNYYKNNFDYECRDGAVRNLFELGMMKRNVKLFTKSKSQSKGRFYATKDKNRLSQFWNFLSMEEELAYAGHGENTNPRDGNSSKEKKWWFDPGSWPPFNPRGSRGSFPPHYLGNIITAYGDGRININTAFPRPLLAMGLNLEAVKRIYWYKLGGNVFPKADASTIVLELIKKNWLFPREKKFKKIKKNIEKVANVKNRLKTHSSYFFTYVTAETKEAKYAAMAVIRRYQTSGGRSRCKIVSWWE